jgi:hypothetical protein
LQLPGCNAADSHPAKIEFSRRDPHPKVPNMTVGRAAAADIVVYITALK